MSVATIGRLAGAMVLESEGSYWLIGTTKRPIDWSEAGFEKPQEPEGEEELPAWRQLETTAAVDSSTWVPRLEVPDESAEQLCSVLHRRMTIQRNGSVSERIWDLVLDGSLELAPGKHQARWVVESPDVFWEIVRDSLLRCS